MEIIIIASIIISALLGMLTGIICTRYVKVYFAILTLAFAELFHSIIMKTYYITGGDEGLNVLRPHLLGFDLSQMPKMQFLSSSYYYYAFVLLAIATFIMWRIVNSPFGLCLKSIRENPEKAQNLGIDITRYKLYAFIIAAVYGATGGALLAPVIGHVDSFMVYWTQSGTIVFMVLLGGFTNFFGPLIGGYVYIHLLDFVMSLTQYWRIIFGGILVLIVISAPNGLVGIFEDIAKKIVNRKKILTNTKIKESI
jgi:branched-chain amino acid transport system permease protein